MNAFKHLNLDTTMSVAVIVAGLAAGSIGYSIDPATRDGARGTGVESVSASPDRVYRITVTAPRELAKAGADAQPSART